MNPSGGNLSFRTAQVSRAGGREYNEDACGQRELCWVLADGLGGHGGGEVASRIAVDSTLGALGGEGKPTAERITQSILDTNAAIHRRQAQEARLERMRTTLVILHSDGVNALWAHVGDSRLYLFRRGRLLIQTEDHSVPQAMVRAGEISPGELRHHEDRNRLLRTVGNADAPRPTIAEPMALHPGDAFLLCSDGYWEYVTETEMEIGLSKSRTPEQWLQAMTLRLLSRAEPGHDNYSAMAILVR